MRSCWLGLLTILLSAGPLLAGPVVSEIMADNESTIVDEDGDPSDWIEIHNPDSTPVSLNGWYLTDNASNLTKWKFPAVTLAPGDCLVVWASSKNRKVVGSPLHTNFSLSKDGEYLGLIRPDGTTVEHSFAPTFPALGADESYGLRFQTNSLVAENSTGKYIIPTSSSNPPSTWRQTSFNDSTWASGPGGFGYGITVPGITVRQVSKAGTMGGLADAKALLALPDNDPLVLATKSDVYKTVNFLGEGSDGNYATNSILPGGGGENYAVSITGFVKIPTAGIYTFGLCSDDGGEIKIDNTIVMQDDSWHGPENHLGSISLTAGVHSFTVVMYEGGYGDSVEFFSAPGTQSSFNASVFDLVGDTANGGLQATTTPTAAGGLVGTNLQTAMGSNADAFVRYAFAAPASGTANSMYLVMRYNDGFVASIDNVTAASANAPVGPIWASVATAVRTNSLLRQPFNLTSTLSSLASGNHVLALQGMNNNSSDGSFLIASELVAGSVNLAQAPAFFSDGLATPGWINGAPSTLGKVADTQFSTKRGFFTSPIQLAITSATPGAVIHYTTDGSAPDATHGTLYTTPLAISSTTVIRACATLEGWTSTDVDTQTYVFLQDVITQSANGQAPAGWPASSGTSQVLDFGMDPDIVNNGNPDIGGQATIKAALQALPSVSITTDLKSLFNVNGSQGIYANPNNRGFAWERAASFEWISPPDANHPNGSSEFQVNAGLRVRGGYSRSTDNPKHAFRLYFRGDYGDSKLKYPIFGRDAAQEFDQIDIRTSQNYSWSFGGDSRNTFLREEACRQALLDMGNPGSHVRYVHLYLNGQYWGLYDIDERPEASFAESYFGGNEEDYDVVKGNGENDYMIGATDGDLAAWQDLWNKSKAHRASPTNTNYFKMMGLAADGVTPTSDPVLLDPNNLIDYMLLTFWSGNLDGCVSYFLGENRGNNWFGSRRRVGNTGQGFRFFVHDFEHSLLDVNENRTGPFTSSNESNFSYSNPCFLHQDLTGNDEYKMRWADRVQKHMFNDGALTAAAWQNRINKLAAFVDGSIAAESARWGDAKTSSPYTRQSWISAQNDLISYLPSRNANVLAQLRADGLYPSIDAPVLQPYGGHQANGVEIAITGPVGAALYYMADGSDPRAIGGAVKAGAQIYSSGTTTESLVPISSSGWKYLGTGVNLGTAWRADGYNDSSWPTGTAELGYGDGDEATTIPIVDVDSSTSGVQKAATTYFRKTFTVSNVSQITSASLSVEYDDAYAVYLNGVRVAGNLPTDPAYNYYSGGSGIEDTIATTTLAASALRNGSNTIAVEIHQAYATSSDISMNLSLTATRSVTATPMILTGPGQRIVRVRAKNGTVWSALSESIYQVGTVVPTAAALIVSEISYAPPAPNNNAEFIELLNTGATTLDLGGARFTEGIDFTFAAGVTLAPGARVLIVKDLAAFEGLYGTGKPVAGIFANDTSLDNNGERLKLEAADGSTLLDFTYDDAFPWPAATGRSAVLSNPSDPSNPQSWRPSSAANGNPGTSDAILFTPGQDLLTYALAGPAPAFDKATSQFSITRNLGADSAALLPEWSTNLNTWSPSGITRVAETVDETGHSTVVWKLDPMPAGSVFLRVRVNAKP